MGIFLSCEKVIPYKGPSPARKLVLNGAFAPDSGWQVQLTQSLGITDDLPEHISFATVRLTSLSDGWEEELVHMDSGRYETRKHYGRIGGEYEMSVVASGFPSIKAKDKIPSSPMVRFLDTLSSDLDGIPVLQLQLEITDQETIDAYVIEVFERHPFIDQLAEAHLYLYEFDPKIANEGLGNDQGAFDRLFLPDTGWENQRSTITFAIERFPSLEPVGQDSTEIRIRVSAVSADYYAYQRSFVRYSLAYYYLSFPQSQGVHSNVDDGFGIFGAYTPVDIPLVIK
ncbi:MAG: DUF4249 family protein [Bacteroidota bacterium]